MTLEILKVGIVSCSGEAVPGGTISRIASRMVLDELRPDATVTICLPLFIAGGQEERDFAATYPTITVDGCEKRCAQRSTEKLSGKPGKSLLIPEILEKHGIEKPTSLRKLKPEETVAVQVVAEVIARAVDEILES
ncbi:MAG: putative zinc-binding protein [Deltaproteobacteria bacterium]|nr:putative zinc-binding protein [Deltaproteobacteria bacterium]